MKILFRKDRENEEEYEIAKKYFEVIDRRTQVKAGDLVLGRYSVLPFYLELQNSINDMGGTLAVSYWGHNYITSMDWVADLWNLTPRTHILDDGWAYLPEGKYIVKGAVNSKKFEWNKSMFANNKKEVIDLYFKLKEDTLIGQQKIVAREFEEFEILEKGLNGLNFINEWRVFIFDGKIVEFGYYWACSEVAEEMQNKREEYLKEFMPLLEEVINRLAIKTFVVDIAKRVDNVWRVIELNDFQMSGLSMIDPEDLYRRLRGFIG